MSGALTDEQKKALSDQIPLGRLGEPEDIAHVVAFLASDAAAYFTGQVIPITGGLGMLPGLRRLLIPRRFIPADFGIDG